MANPQTPKFPGALVTDTDTLVIKDNAFAQLTAGIDASVTTLPLTNVAFNFPCYLKLENEIVLAAGPASGSSITNCTRGQKGTTAHTHDSGTFAFGYVFDTTINQLSAEVKAIETALGTNLANVVKPATTLVGDVIGTPAATVLAATAVTPGSYGDGTHTPAITVDAKGRVTAAASVPITGAAPTGSAGGDLTGTFPNPTLVTTAVTPATYGDGTHTGQFTVDSKGRITAASNVTITGAAPTGAAGGDLAGTFPNPTLAPTAVTPGTYGDGTHTPTITVDSKGRITAAASTTITGAAPVGAAGGDLAGTFPNPTLAPTAVTPGVYGDASNVAAITVDAKGRVTSASAIPIAASPTGSAGGVLTGTYPNPSGFASAPAFTGVGTITTAWSIGTNPSGSGGIRLSNNSAIAIRNFANTADLGIMDVTSADIMRFAYTGISKLQTNATMILLGGSSSSSPALKKSSTKMAIRLADDSGDAGLTSSTIDQSGKTTTYNGIATTGWGQPAIYGTGRQTAQTAAIASVATYTVGAADGTFLITANLNLTAVTTATIAVTCTYTDETNTSRTLTLNFNTLTGTIINSVTDSTGVGPYSGVPVHIRAKAATSITLATSGTFTTVTYNAEGYISQIG